MQESKRIKNLFVNFYNGNPWTEIKLTDILIDITAEQAAKQLIPNANTIWQLVQHCVGWRENVLQKMLGADFKSPEDNYLGNPADISEIAWSNLLHRLKQAEADWENFLNNLGDAFLNEPYVPSKGEWTNYEVIQGLLHHDNYHFGQIVMLKKLTVI